MRRSLMLATALSPQIGYEKAAHAAQLAAERGLSLREACDRVKKARVLEVIEIANRACKDMGIERPKVAVAGLNPHCGENGLFGTEETIIEYDFTAGSDADAEKALAALEAKRAEAEKEFAGEKKDEAAVK